eukprot:s90_g51.t1
MTTPKPKELPPSEQVPGDPKPNGPDAPQSVQKDTAVKSGGVEKGSALNRSTLRSPEQPASVEPLFTQEQVRQFQELHDQAPWLYAQRPPLSFATPQRPSFLSQEELNTGGAPSRRDPQMEYFQDRYMHDQFEKEEIRKTLRLLVEENRMLKNQLEAISQGTAQRSRELEEPRFSTPEEQEKSEGKSKAGSEAKEAETPKKAAEAHKEAAQTPIRFTAGTKEAAQTPKEPAEAPKEAAQTPKRFEESFKEAAQTPKKAAEAQEEAAETPIDPGGGGSKEAETPKRDEVPRREESINEKSMQLMVAMMETMKEMQKRSNESRDEAGLLRGVEIVRPGVADLPPLQPWSPTVGPLQLGDWMLLVSPIVADLSLTSEEWWSVMKTEAEKWYQTHLTLGPIDRIKHAAEPPQCLREERWQRLERRVATMLLQALPEGVREELVSARRLTVFGVLTHLLLTYCPGGVQEKQTLLRNLEDPTEIQNMSEAPASLRKWLRWRKRTEEIGAISPDPTLLLKGLNKLTRRGDRGKPKGRDGQSEEPKARQRCKFFLTDSGCRRGKECTWSHEEKDGKRRCYVCGSVEHLAPSCTRPKAPGDGSPRKQKGAKVEGEEKGQAAKDETPKSASSDPSLKDLLDEANKMIKSLSSSSSSANSEKGEKEEDSKEDVMQKLQQQLEAAAAA